ncbi:MAG: ribbon-helix-helix protein, CopG family [Planctomycetes bacterium]|nr:ribbon-helix-helix protein, CopG family [Planctomycetota bacterium]MBM4058750.1 ribbon-helix-helix protein, CopG family [Planctomycetota bacterium]
MQKIQILFSDPVMERLRAVARQQDRPVSELVRRAVDRLLEQVPALPPKQPARFPTFHGGGVLVDAGRLKDVLHGQDEEVRPAGRSDSRRRR